VPREEAGIVVEGLQKRFGDVEAVRGIGLTVAPGETFGFLGPNGAGKSTTINMLCTLVRPTAGTARVAGAYRPGGARGRRVGMLMLLIAIGEFAVE
jgi:ABC-2 type transport system ATP-binding protein